jgi:DNA-binding IclR family transcriptional regulator
VSLRYTSPIIDAISCSMPADRLDTPERERQIARALDDARHQIEASAPLAGRHHP